MDSKINASIPEIKIIKMSQLKGSVIKASPRSMATNAKQHNPKRKMGTSYKVTIDGKDYKAVAVQSYKPSLTTLAYRVQVRK